jgi:VanZ family protein
VDRPLKFFRALFWLCFVGLTGLALSPAPYLPPMGIFNWWDKAQHAIGYGTLTVSALLAYPKVSKLRLAALLCLHGCLIEVLQYFSGYRYGDWQDALADGVGVIVALVFFLIVSNLSFMVRPLDQEAAPDK